MYLRIVAGLLLAALLVLQYRIWASPSGMREVWRLERAIEAQVDENERLGERNRTLAAEVRDLKEGKQAIEERARTDLGMVRANETFFQVVPPSPAGDVPETTPGTVPGQRTAQADTP
ncbi:MAG TPA: cell division protein FtsB [Steroidobacteraceae bacterium]|nr:cell division protein FtsB [Steroidobacteraceae bacterium]